VKDFATGYGSGATVAAAPARWSPQEDEALAFATGPQMGLRRADAERLLQRAKAGNPVLIDTQELLTEMLRLYAVGV
jgi:hypothetical protein